MQAGDVICFVEVMDKVSFPEAVKRLNGHQQNAAVVEHLHPIKIRLP